MAKEKTSPGPMAAKDTRSVLATVVEEHGELHTPLADAIRAGDILAPFTLRRIKTSGLAPGDFRIAEDYNPQGSTPIWLADYVRRSGYTSANGRKGSFLLEESFGAAHLADLGTRFRALIEPHASPLSSQERAEFLGYFAAKRNALIQARLYTGALTALAEMPVDFMQGLDPASTAKAGGVPPAYKKLLSDYAAFRYADEFKGKNPPDAILRRAHTALCADADGLQLMLKQSPKGQEHVLAALRQQGDILDHKLRLLDPDAADSCAARIKSLADFQDQVSKRNKDDFAKSRHFPTFDLFREVNAKRGAALPPRYYHPKTDDKGHIVINEQGQPIFYHTDAPSFGSMVPKIIDRVSDAGDPVSFMVELCTHTVHAIRVSRGMMPHVLGNNAVLTEEELARGAVASLVSASGMDGHGSPDRISAKAVLQQASEIHAQQQQSNLQKKSGLKMRRGGDDDRDGPPPPSSPKNRPPSPPPPEASGGPAEEPYYDEEDPFIHGKDAAPPPPTKPSTPPKRPGDMDYTLKTGAQAPQYSPIDKGTKKSGPAEGPQSPPFEHGRN